MSATGANHANENHPLEVPPVADEKYERSSQPSGEEPVEQNDTAKEPRVRDDGESDGDGAAVDKIQSKNSVNNVASVPNGGLRAWLQVLGAFCLFFNTWGVLNTFGVYQTYYESGELFRSSSSNLSWIGALQSFLLLIIGVCTGPIYDAGHFRPLLYTGSFLIVFGHMMLSLCTKYWEALLAQAFVIGIGAGCLFVPSVGILSTYFTTKIASAVGIAASGSSLGGVIYPIVFYRLQPRIGFPWTVRVIGFMALGMLAIPCAVMKMRVKPAAKRKLWDLQAFKEIPYASFVFGGFLAFVGLYVVFFYVSYYVEATRIGDEEIAFYQLPILNAASILGRILPNILADRVGPQNVFLPAVFVSGVLSLCLIAAKTLGSVIAIAALYGFFSGALVSLPPTIFVQLSPNRGVIGTRMGMGFSGVALGVLIGTPIAGAILGPENDFRSLWAFGGSFILGGGLFFGWTRMLKAGWKAVVKV